MYTSRHDSLVFRIDPKLLQHRPPRRTLATTLDVLAKRVETGELDANLIVDILDENRLLPYIISDTKNLHIVSLGQTTNASKIGDLIVSEECIRGTYELCLSFLNFVLITLKDPKYVDSSKTILASVAYIANEVYPNHRIWTYRNISDMNSILCKCTEIFHQILVHKCSNDLETICVLNLSQNQAHKQLLDVIVEGNQAIKKVITGPDFNGEETMRAAPIVRCTRQSLAIFNKLLSSDDILNKYRELPNAATGQNPDGSPNNSPTMTTIEKALFDTSIRPGLLQNLFSYIYQKEDSGTACLAVDLIKRIAEKFSMSLMASLGSEADRVCEFFVDCLGDKNANIDLEIAILDLLSTCVKHQPGLIELFLNFKRDSKNTNETSKDTEQQQQQQRQELNSLEVVMNLLKECRDQQSDAHRSLHTYVMKFILTFWQKCHSAIEQFDKSDQFWDSITYPLVKFIESDLSSSLGETYNPSHALGDKLNSFVLMILAREIFNVNAGINERKMNPQLRDKLDELHKKNLLAKYSNYVLRRCTHIVGNMDKKEDYNRLLSAWRDYLASCSKYKPFEISNQVQQQLVQDILNCLTIELRLGEKLDKERIVAIGETVLLIWTKWMTTNAAGDEIFHSIHELLYLADSCKEYLPFSFLLTFQSTLNSYLMHNREYLINSKRSFDLLVPALQLMQFSLKIMEKYINKQAASASAGSSIEFEYKPGVESRLCQASIMTFSFIIDGARPHVNLWISYLQTSLRTDSLVQFLTILMNKRAGAEVCLSMIELLLYLSSIGQTADYLNKSGLINQVNMISVSAYERPYAHLAHLATIKPLLSSSTSTTTPTTPTTITSKNKQQEQTNDQTPTNKLMTNANHSSNHHHHHHHHGKAPMSDTEKTYLDNMNSNLDWLPIYQHVIRLNISMILTLGNDYIGTAVEFLSIHCIRICELVELLRTKPRSVNMEEALQLVYLINLVLRHGCLWLKKNRQSYLAISDEIAKTAYTLATSALPPPVVLLNAIQGDAGKSSEQQATKKGAGAGGGEHTSLKPRDCLIYARCCYDFAKYTEAERVLFQTKFGDKNGFIKEAGQIYGDELSQYAFHLAALICLKTNRQSDSIDFALQVFSDDPEHFDILSALTQNRI